MPSPRGRGHFILETGLAAALVAAAGGGSQGFARAADDARPTSVQGSGLGVSALGRIEPEHGILTLGLPSMPSASNGAVLRKLMVEAGNHVTAGQLLAESDAAALEAASIAVARAEFELAERRSEMAVGEEQSVCSRAEVAQRTSGRLSNLLKTGVASNEEADVAAGDAKALSGSCASARIAMKAAAASVDVARARLDRTEVEHERAIVRAPVDGLVLRIIRRPGETVDAAGVLELGRVSRMYAIAEVYETDIRRVRAGQKATVTSNALEAPLTGAVEHVRLKVRKQDTTGTDPAARKDARIVEVEVLLDHPEAVAALTNLQVEVLIHP